MPQDLAVFGNRAVAIDRIGQRNIGYRSETVAHHASEHSIRGQLHRAHSELLADNAVEGARCSAALEVAEHA